MSERTREALERALAAHIADTQPEYPILVDWTLGATSVGAEVGITGYSYLCSTRTPTHSLLGLIDLLHESVTRPGEDDAE